MKRLGIILALVTVAAGGGGQSEFDRARRLEADRRPAEALRWYERAAERGHPVAQLTLAARLRPEQPGRAARWFARAADQGVTEAAKALGIMYAYGEGVEPDETLALARLHQAANAGSAGAAYELGKLYRSLLPPRRDRREAERWFRRAAELGYPPAGDELSPRARNRESMLRRARIVEDDRPDPDRASILAGPPAPLPLGPDANVYCDYHERRNGGGNPKFRCFAVTGEREPLVYLDDRGRARPEADGVRSFEWNGREVTALAVRSRAGWKPLGERDGFRERPARPLELKVKYRVGSSPRHRDMYTEVAATRLFEALGFPADRMYPVRRVRCHRCPGDPFPDAPAGPPGRWATFTEVAVELRYLGPEGDDADTLHEGGWSFGDEVWRLRTGEGRSAFSPRQKRHLDELLLLLGLLEHTSNLPEQNRLVCRRRSRRRLMGLELCPETTMLVHDLGSVFSKKSAESFETWRDVPVLREDGCVLALELKVRRGDAAREYRISEEARRSFVARIDRLSDAELSAVFEAARFDRYDPSLAARGLGREEIFALWTGALRDKVDAIRRRSCKGS